MKPLDSQLSEKESHPDSGILRTMQWVYQKICLGEDPWTALSGFTHDFFRWRLVHFRQELLDNPIDIPGQPTRIRDLNIEGLQQPDLLFPDSTYLLTEENQK